MIPTPADQTTESNQVTPIKPQERLGLIVTGAVSSGWRTQKGKFSLAQIQLLRRGVIFHSSVYSMKALYSA